MIDLQVIMILGSQKMISVCNDEIRRALTRFEMKVKRTARRGLCDGNWQDPGPLKDMVRQL